MCQYEELDGFGSGHRLLECPCECGIEPPGSISHGVREYICVGTYRVTFSGAHPAKWRSPHATSFRIHGDSYTVGKHSHRKICLWHRNAAISTLLIIVIVNPALSVPYIRVLSGHRMLDHSLYL